jgi:hypothetical protein
MESTNRCNTQRSEKAPFGFEFGELSDAFTQVREWLMSRTSLPGIARFAEKEKLSIVLPFHTES